MKIDVMATKYISMQYFTASSHVKHTNSNILVYTCFVIVLVLLLMCKYLPVQYSSTGSLDSPNGVI